MYIIIGIYLYFQNKLPYSSSKSSEFSTVFIIIVYLFEWGTHTPLVEVHLSESPFP